MTVATKLGRTILTEASRPNHRTVLSLVFGLVIGFFLAVLFFYSSPTFDVRPDWLHYYHTSSHHESDEDLRREKSIQRAIAPEKDVTKHNHTHEDSSVAAMLHSEVRVLCWIMTNPSNHKSKAIHVKRTWGKRCNKLLFMSSAKDDELGTVALPVNEGRENLWAKTKEAFKYIYAHHMQDADWFLKADDDTYVIVENLRYMLYPYSPKTAIYFGARFKPFVKQGYMSGGAGYVLSKEAVRRFVVNALPNPKICDQGPGGAEDVQIGKCLANVKVMAGDSRDSHLRGRFFPFQPQGHLLADPKLDYWYWQYIYYKTDEGLDCCSDYAISFHYVPYDHMYVYDYLIYHLQPYGVAFTHEPLPAKLPPGKVQVMPTAFTTKKKRTAVDNTTEPLTATPLKSKDKGTVEKETEAVK